MKKLIAILAMVAVAIIVPAALLAWGPARTQTFTTASPANYIIFNSITDNPSHGDERNFVQVRDAATPENSAYVDQINVTAGHEYVIYMYFHNNAAANLGLNATGTYVKAQIPGLVPSGNTGAQAVGFVGSPDARPVEVYDEVNFTNNSGSSLALQYVAGSATIHSKGAVNNRVMSDTIVTTGALIGYNALDGIVPGCDQFAGYVTFRVRAGQPNFTVTKQVRKTGTSAWLSTVAVNPGDSIDYLVTYVNTGTIDQYNVVLTDVLPAGVNYTNGSAYLSNEANSAKPLNISDNIISKDGINIGNYSANSNGIVKFSATVAANNLLPTCGLNTLRNSVTATTENGAKTATADVTATKTCNPTPTEYPVTGAGESFAAILGLGAVVTSVAYYIASRRQLTLNR